MSKINLNLKYMIFQHVTLTDPVSGYFVGKIEARVSYEKTFTRDTNTSDGSMDNPQIRQFCFVAIKYTIYARVKENVIK